MEDQKKYIWNTIKFNSAKVIDADDKRYEWKADPVGYFLIQVNRESQEIEVGLCEYDDVNNIKVLIKGTKPDQICQRIIDEGLVSRMDHAAYLGKEVARAWICMKLGVKYVQDGTVTGEFPEVKWLEKNGSALSD
jgi:tetrahydromethanopterin S-methyltransferase subunit A